MTRHKKKMQRLEGSSGQQGSLVVWPYCLLILVFVLGFSGSPPVQAANTIETCESAPVFLKKQLDELDARAVSLQALLNGQWPQVSNAQVLLGYDEALDYQLQAFRRCDSFSQESNALLDRVAAQLGEVKQLRTQLLGQKDYVRVIRKILNLYPLTARPADMEDRFAPLLLLAYNLQQGESAGDEVLPIWRDMLKYQRINWSLTDFGLNREILILHQLREQVFNKSIFSMALDGFSLIRANDLLLELKFGVLHSLLIVSAGQEHLTIESLVSSWGWQLAVCLLLFGMLLQLAKRTSRYVSILQKNMYRSDVSLSVKTKLEWVLRLLRANARWLTMAVASALIALVLPSISWLIFFYPLAIIYIAFNFIWIVSEWSIERLYDRMRVPVALTIEEKSAQQTRTMARQIVVTWLVIFLTRGLFGDACLALLVKSIGVGCIWYFLFALLSKHQDVLVQLAEKRFSEKIYAVCRRLLESWLVFLALPIVFVFVQVNEVLVVWHRLMLKNEHYQKLSAKLLRIKLDRAVEEEPDQEEDAASQEFLSGTAYERWFSAEPPGSIEKLWVENANLKSVTDLLASWLKGGEDENALILSGDQGAGKSTLVKQLAAQWDACELKTVSLGSKVLSEEAAFEAISQVFEVPMQAVTDVLAYDEVCEPTIIVIDEMQNSFLADVGCFDGVKTLMSCTNAGLKNIFWLLVFNTHSWDYLNRALGHSRYFTGKKNIQRWSHQDIRSLVLQRHKASRRKLVYDELLISSTGQDTAGAMRAAETRFFHLLWEQCDGNPGVALALWRNCIRVKERHLIEVGVPERFLTKRFTEFGDQLPFVFAAIVIHGELTTEQCLLVTNLSEASVRRSLKIGIDQGVLERRPDGAYLVKAVWYEPLVAFLSRRNLLHG